MLSDEQVFCLFLQDLIIPNISYYLVSFSLYYNKLKIMDNLELDLIFQAVLIQEDPWVLNIDIIFFK